MRIILIAVALLPASLPVRQWEPHKKYPKLTFVTQNQTINRMLRIMQSYYSSGEQRIVQLNYQRVNYEETKEFEEGYIMGEIIERYRRLVEHVKICQKMKSYTVFDTITRMELAQRLYFEVFHLVNMMHEVPRKYGYESEDEEGSNHARANVSASTPPTNESKVEEAIEDLERNEIRRIKQERARAKLMKKMRAMMLLQGKIMTQTTKSRTNKWWPLEYGWELDYWW